MTMTSPHRSRHPELFAEGAYEPVTAEGAESDRVCCFVRKGADASILVAASRFCRSLGKMRPAG